MALFQRGAAERRTRETKANVRSSRSHCVLAVRVERVVTQLESGVTRVAFGTLQLVDLAGSERVCETGAAGAALTEARHINRSLLTLGKVIKEVRPPARCGDRRVGLWRAHVRMWLQVVNSQDAARCQRKVPVHVPFRDSKLTFLLQNSIGGNARTFVVAAVAPGARAGMHAASTLDFAQRAKSVRNRARVNTGVRGDRGALEATVKRLQAQVAELQVSAGADRGCEGVRGARRNGHPRAGGAGGACTAGG
jgi:kinesin family member 15